MSDEKKYVPSVIPPGNVQCKINSVELRLRPYTTNEGKTVTDVVLNVETKPIIDVAFKGLKRDYNNPNSEAYKGQVARLRLNEWGFKDTDRADFSITKEDDILRHLKSLFMEVGQHDWFKAQDDKYDTKDIQKLIDAINKEQPFKDFYMYYCLASRQYLNKKNYKTDDLYLPKYSKETGKPFSVNMHDLIKFDIATHVVAPKVKEVQSFEPTKEVPASLPIEDINWEASKNRAAAISGKKSMGENTEFLSQGPVKQETPTEEISKLREDIGGADNLEKMPWD